MFFVVGDGTFCVEDFVGFLCGVSLCCLLGVFDAISAGFAFVGPDRLDELEELLELDELDELDDFV